jgi:PEP-CTERM motif
MRSIIWNRNAFKPPCISLVALGTALAVTAAVAWCNPASATTFTFGDIALCTSSAGCNSAFGTTNGYGSTGIYQETNTGTPTLTRLGSVSSNIPGEFIQNTSPNASQGLQLFGWGQSLNNGQIANTVYNLANPGNGTVLYFQYKTGVTGGLFGNGTTTPFTFNSFDIKSGASLSFTLDGFLGGVLQDTAVLTTTGGSFTTFTENWTNVDTMEIVSTAGLPLNWGSNTIQMDNVVINNAVPEPATWAMMVLGFLGIGIMSYRRRGTNFRFA